MITVNGINHSYDGTQRVLCDIDLTLPRGRLTSLVGPNGAGKSTLLTVIARLLRPDTGRVLVDDLDVATARADDVARRLAVLRQENHLTARVSVADLVRFGRFPYSKGRLTAEDHRIADEAMAYVELDGLRDRYLDELSGGQRQRAYLAMVLAQDTEYVLLDEPLNNLDMKHAAAVMSLLRRITDELGRTVVLVLHDINVASAYSDHIVAMRDGAVAAQGAPEQIIRPDVLSSVFDLDMDVVDVGGHRIGVHWVARRPAESPT